MSRRESTEERMIRYLQTPTAKGNSWILGYATRMCHLGNIDTANPFEINSDQYYAFRRGYWVGDKFDRQRRRDK